MATGSYLSVITLNVNGLNSPTKRQRLAEWIQKQDPYICCIQHAAKLLQSCLTLCDPIDGSPPGTPSPWDSPGKNTGVGCHFLLQCMKVKSESEVAQSCPTLSNPMDCSLPGSSIHRIFQPTSKQGTHTD